MGFKNIFLGSTRDWQQSDIDLINASITRAMQEPRLNNVMAQYFPGSLLSCDAFAEAAQYWESIYLHDWANMAVQHAAD